MIAQWLTCGCVCVCPEVFPSISLPPKAGGFVFSWKAHSACIVIHFSIWNLKAAVICIPRHASVVQTLTVFCSSLLLYTSEDSDGWLSHCLVVNLSCVKLSVLKEAVSRWRLQHCWKWYQVVSLSSKKKKCSVDKRLISSLLVCVCGCVCVLTQ